MGRLSGFNVTLRQMFKPRAHDAVPEGQEREARAPARPPRPQSLRGRDGEVHRVRAVRGRVPGAAASTCAAPTTRSTIPVSPGERYGFVYEINYLRCIHCDLCVEACPTEAITETKLFEFSFTNRADAIYTKDELLVGDDGRAKRLPWELWTGGEDDHTSAWMRATSPSGVGRLRRSRRLVGRARLRCAAAEQGRPSRVRRAGPELMDTLIFYICAVAVIVGALGVVLAHNPVHSALFLLLTLVSVAVLFLQQDAALVAIIQIVVYASAIVVLFVFVITLLGVDQHESFDEPSPFQRPVAIVLGALLFVQVVVLAGHHWATGEQSRARRARYRRGPATSRRSRRASSPITSGRSR